jgi:hypothetical protein
MSETFVCRKGGKGHEHKIAFKDAKDFKYVKMAGADRGTVRAIGVCPKDGASLSLFVGVSKLPSGAKVHPAPPTKSKKSKKGGSRKSRKSNKSHKSHKSHGSRKSRKSRKSQ